MGKEQLKSQAKIVNAESTLIKQLDFIDHELSIIDSSIHFKNKKNLEKIKLNEVDKENTQTNIYYNYMYEITII